MPDTSVCCGSRPVVVLADREKEEMDDELRQSLKGYKIEWHTRSGAPHCSSDLDRVAAGQAKNVILLDDNTEVGCLHTVPLKCIATSPLFALPLTSRYAANRTCWLFVPHNFCDFSPRLVGTYHLSSNPLLVSLQLICNPSSAVQRQGHSMSLLLHCPTASGHQFSIDRTQHTAPSKLAELMDGFSQIKVLQKVRQCNATRLPAAFVCRMWDRSRWHQCWAFRPPEPTLLPGPS